MQENTGFELQGALSGSCAQRSIVHSLLLLGIPISITQAHKRTRVSPLLASLDGTDIPQIIRAIHQSKCIASKHKIHNSRKLWSRVNSYLDRGIPLITSVNNEGHWLVLSGRSAGRYYWIDSSDEELYGIDNSEQIEEWMLYENKDHKDEFYFIAVTPKQRRQLRHSLVTHFEHVYDLFDDDELAENWGVYLDDLLGAFALRGKIDANDFFDRFEKAIYEAALYSYAHSDRAHLRWEIGNYRKVAKAHRMTLSEKGIPYAIASLSACLTCLAWEES